MVYDGIQVPDQEIADLCRRHHIRKLALFGSILTDQFRPDSDVDVLVEFDPAHVPGFEFVRIQDELKSLFEGHRIDLITSKFLNRRIRKEVLDTAQTQYAQG